MALRRASWQTIEPAILKTISFEVSTVDDKNIDERFKPLDRDLPLLPCRRQPARVKTSAIFGRSVPQSGLCLYHQNGVLDCRCPAELFFLAAPSISGTSGGLFACVKQIASHV